MLLLSPSLTDDWRHHSLPGLVERPLAVLVDLALQAVVELLGKRVLVSVLGALVAFAATRASTTHRPTRATHAAASASASLRASRPRNATGRPAGLAAKAGASPAGATC